MNMAFQPQVYSDINYNLMQDNNAACGFNEFSFDFQPEQFGIQDQAQCNNRNFCFGDNNSTGLLPKSNNNDEWLTFSQSIAIQVEKQRQDIDRFISIQNERLRLALLHQRKCQLALLLRNYESKIQILVRQKDEEISRAMNRAMELEEYLRRIEIENHTWQRVARENEATVISLNQSLEQLKESANHISNMAEHADSCSQIVGTIEKETEELDKQYDDEAMRWLCKSCTSRKSCLVFLPCRHLCACKDCETLLDSCPVCKMAKEAVIEALV